MIKKTAVAYFNKERGVIDNCHSLENYLQRITEVKMKYLCRDPKVSLTEMQHLLFCVLIHFNRLFLVFSNVTFI